jgi:predicted lipoprotein with Yx(FWY)xxD motif
MKNLLALLCAALVSLGLTACDDQAERDTDRTKTTTEEARAEEEMAEGEEEMAEGEEDMAEEEMAEEEMAMIEVAEKEPFGEYLVNAEGMSLYMFEADTKGEKSACDAACAEAWPPVSVESAEMLTASEELDDAMLGTIERPDGTMQVTYNGWPLYTFVKDTNAGDTMGQDKEGFGAEWYLMSPDGEKLEAEEDEQAVR